MKSFNTPKPEASEKPQAESKELKPTQIDSAEVTYRHKARQGMVALFLGKEPLTSKPIEKFVKFSEHLYKTSDATEIEKLDEWCLKANGEIQRFDEYKLMVNSQPQEIAMEIDGKKVKVPLKLLEDAYKQNQTNAKQNEN